MTPRNFLKSLPFTNSGCRCLFGSKKIFILGDSKIIMYRDIHVSLKGITLHIFYSISVPKMYTEKIITYTENLAPERSLVKTFFYLEFNAMENTALETDIS